VADRTATIGAIFVSNATLTFPSLLAELWKQTGMLVRSAAPRFRLIRGEDDREVDEEGSRYRLVAVGEMKFVIV
jgi:hypothetical protein